MSVQTEITRINKAKTDIIAAINEKGVATSPTAKIETLANDIRNIKSGGEDWELISSYTASSQESLSTLKFNSYPDNKPLTLRKFVLYFTSLINQKSDITILVTGQNDLEHSWGITYGYQKAYPVSFLFEIAGSILICDGTYYQTANFTNPFRGNAYDNNFESVGFIAVSSAASNGIVMSAGSSYYLYGVKA